MCGICGILNTHSPVRPDILKRMADAIVHRGPDDEGFYVDGPIGLGMRRLSVIDVAGGHQPQHNETRDCHIVFNGEIYNFPELRIACEARGHTFATHSDTETILHLYEDYGPDCVQHLNGMFAFALYDARTRSALLSRDRLGIKPLYYAIAQNNFIFASEIKAILQHPDIPRDIDHIALDQYLTHKYIPGPRTIYSAIKKLPPGHHLHWQNGRVEIRPYWRLSFAPGPARAEADIADELRERLQRAVQSQMISDVPLGALLSGGIDSSLIVALMSQVSNRPVQTFSIGFEERTYSELDAARVVATQFGTQHREHIVRPDVRDLFPRLVGHFDEPFGDSSAIPTYLVCQHAREHVTVALSGTGADELFAGYERYRATALQNALPDPVWRVLSGIADHLPAGHAKRGLIHRAKRFLSSIHADPLLRHRHITGLFSQTERADLLRPEWHISHGEDAMRDRFVRSDAADILNKLLDVDTGGLLSDDYLVKDDRMSMAVSLELRVPFLDHTLVEFAASLPPHLKLRRLTTKYILKRAARPLLPNRILRRPKHGFEMPIAHWLKTDLRDMAHDLLLSSDTLLNPEPVRRLLDAHQSGRENHSGRIWALMSLAMWLRDKSDDGRRTMDDGNRR